MNADILMQDKMLTVTNQGLLDTKIGGPVNVVTDGISGYYDWSLNGKVCCHKCGVYYWPGLGHACISVQSLGGVQCPHCNCLSCFCHVDWARIFAEIAKARIQQSGSTMTVADTLLVQARSRIAEIKKRLDETDSLKAELDTLERMVKAAEKSGK